MIARFFSLSSALAATLAITSPLAAQPGARAYLEGQHAEVNRLLGEPANGEAAQTRRTARLRTLLDGLLDYQALSQRALGDHWEAQSEGERQRFVQLLQRLVQRNYEGSLERITEFEVSYERESRRGELTVVHTLARSRSQRRAPPVAIDYTMQRSERGWRVVDVTTDGVSMVDNYRSQFNRIIARNGWEDLITRMERRLENGAEE